MSSFLRKKFCNPDNVQKLTGSMFRFIETGSLKTMLFYGCLHGFVSANYKIVIDLVRKLNKPIKLGYQIIFYPYLHKINSFFFLCSWKMKTQQSDFPEK